VIIGCHFPEGEAFNNRIATPHSIVHSISLFLSSSSSLLLISSFVFLSSSPSLTGFLSFGEADRPKDRDGRDGGEAKERRGQKGRWRGGGSGDGRGGSKTEAPVIPLEQATKEAARPEVGARATMSLTAAGEKEVAVGSHQRTLLHCGNAVGRGSASGGRRCEEKIWASGDLKTLR
jgi:hypothetical protein